MRTTLTIEDSIDRKLKEIANRTNKPFKQVVNETLERGLAIPEQPRKKYKMEPASLGEPPALYDLTKSLALSEGLEVDALLNKLKERK